MKYEKPLLKGYVAMVIAGTSPLSPGYPGDDDPGPGDPGSDEI